MTPVKCKKTFKQSELHPGSHLGN